MSADHRGFTLPELLVAITILGIIMAAIGAMITTAFTTSAIVRARLDGSRAPKLVSFYWVPDVEGAEQVEIGGGAANCGAGERALVTFTWTKFPSVIAADAPTPEGGVPATATWWVRPRGTRTQVVRLECADNLEARSATVIPDVAEDDVEVTEPGARRYRIAVSVPDTSEPDKTFEFAVDGAQEVIPVPAP